MASKDNCAIHQEHITVTPENNFSGVTVCVISKQYKSITKMLGVVIMAKIGFNYLKRSLF